MDLTPERLAAQCGEGVLPPACLVAGPEVLRVQEAADAVRAAARAQGASEREVFHAGERDFDWNQVAASFGAPGLFSARRLVEIRLPSGRPGKEGSEVIQSFCDDPPPDVVLLVTADEWSNKHAGRWSEAIGRIGVVAIAWQVKPHELPGWIEARMRSRGVRAGRDAVLRLAERVEGNLLAAAQEIDKLALLVGGEVVDVARMEALVADSARYDVFRLVDAALNGNAGQVSRMLAGLRAEGEAVPALMGMVVMELQRVAALARVHERGGNIAAEFRAQRVWESKQAVYRRALSRHSAAQWERLVAEAGRVDRVAKGRVRAGEESADAWLLLERLLLAVAAPKASRLLVS